MVSEQASTSIRLTRSGRSKGSQYEYAACKFRQRHRRYRMTQRMRRSCNFWGDASIEGVPGPKTSMDACPGSFQLRCRKNAGSLLKGLLRPATNSLMQRRHLTVAVGENLKITAGTSRPLHSAEVLRGGYQLPLKTCTPIFTA